MKRILVVTHYFYPENSKINDFILGLLELGHEVEVLTGKPNYPKGDFFKGYTFFGQSHEIYNGIKVHRVPVFPRKSGGSLRLILNFCSAPFFSIFKIFFLGKNFDRILVFAPSPITTAIPAIFYKFIFRKTEVQLWLQDLWPHTFVAASNINNRLFYFLVKSLSIWIYRHTDKILSQSQGFITELERMGIKANKIRFLPNYSESYYKPLLLSQIPKSDLRVPNHGKVIMFAGNIGESQNFELIIESAKILKKEFSNLYWVIIGDGRFKQRAEQLVIENELKSTFIFLGSYPPELMPHFLHHADALILSLKDKLTFNLTIPSKLQSYMACGKPIIGLVKGESAFIIKESASGVVTEKLSSDEVVVTVSAFLTLSEADRIVMGHNSLKYYTNNFSRESVIRAYKGF